MGRNNRNSGGGDPEARKGPNNPRSNGIARPQQPAYAFAGGRARADEGRSGYGSESVRPYLRAQLRLKELLASPYNLADSWARRGKKNGNGER